jgi:hypothetical protein
MPTTYRLAAGERLVYSRAWGVVTDEELAMHSRALRADPRFSPDFRQLQDLVEVTAWKVTVGGLRALAAINPFGTGGRRAVVVSGDVGFGLARMHESLRGDSPDALHVFRRMDEALAWLALPADWRPPAATTGDPVFQSGDAAPGA